MRIMVMGTGGVGGYFGGKLAAAGNEVTFIARGKHGDAIRHQGLRVDSPNGALHISPARCVSSPSEAPAVDAVLFCVKLTDTEAAAQALLPVIKAGAHVFTFQNGVESAARLDGVFGPGRTVSGIAYISAVLSSPGHVIHTSQIPRRDGAPSARVQTLLRACQTAVVEATVVSDITRAIWEKFVRLAPLASITALTRAPIGQLRTEPRSRRLLQSLVEEAVTVGVAKKTGLASGEVELVMKSVDGLDGSMRASMAFDIENGKPLESHYLSGAVVRIGEEVGLPTPVHRFFYDALAVWEKGAAK